MGKRLIQQRRGRTRGRFRSPTHRFKGKIKYDRDTSERVGIINDIIHEPGHTAPVAIVKLSNNEKIMFLAPEGIGVGQKIKFSKKKNEISLGNILPIGRIPEGVPIYNVEISPGDGGKLVRAGGTNASIVSHDAKKTVIRLPSGGFKTLDSECRATVGVVAGGGRKEKPFLKAGKKHFEYRRKGKQYPIVRGVAMCAVSHPHGGGNHQHVGGPSTIRRGSSHGKNVGNIAARRTGKR
jgi:large subunit ribosomal protein L2